MASYNDDEMLKLSGIQHYVFCPRQWALIHIEQQWIDNHLTMEGSLLHSRVDNPFIRKTNGSSILTLRGFNLASHKLGFSGTADAVEFHPLDNVNIKKLELFDIHKFTVLPIEYKRGHRKINNCDRLQVTAQAMILEEMLGIKISQGAIFYWEERHREYFDITQTLRNDIKMISNEMHHIMSTHVLPEPIVKKSCRSCSLYDICLPLVYIKDVRQYLNHTLNEETT